MAADPKKQPSEEVKTPKATETPKIDEIEILHDKAHPHDLVLLVNGKKEITTEAELEKLLKLDKISAKTITSLLKSPTDDKEKAAAMHNLLILFVAIKADQNKYSLLAALKRELFKINLLLGKELRREAAAKALNIAYQQQINKTLTYSRSVAQQTPKNDNASALCGDAIRKQIMDAYTLRSKIIGSELEDLMEEAEQHEQTMVAHDEEHSRIIERYETMDLHVNELDKHSDSLEKIQDRREKLAAARAVLAVIENGIKDLGQKIQEHINNGEDEQVIYLLTSLDGLSVQAEGMNAMMSVINEEKIFYDAKGKTTFTDENNTTKPVSFKNATYVIDANKRLHKDEETGKFYLIANDQDFSSMTAEEKATAQMQFEQAKPKITSIKETLKEYKAWELSASNVTKSKMVAQAEQFQKDIMEKSNQLTQANADNARIKSMLSEPNADLPNVPMPKPMPSGTKKSTTKSTPDQSYRQILASLGGGRPLNPEAIDRLRSSLGSARRAKEAQDAVTNQLKPGEILTATKMNSFLRNMALLGVDVNKPNVTAIPDRHPSAEEQKASPSPSPLK